MLYSLTALLVVVVIAALVFRLWRPIALQFTDAQAFVRRRNVWMALTILSFIAPSFWFFFLVAVPLLVWAAAKDENPIALYVLMLHVIPPISIDIPVVGINELFSLDMYRVLSLSILLPIFWKARYRESSHHPPRSRLPDFLIISFGLLQVLLFVRPDTPNAVYLHDSLSNICRRGFLFFIDCFLVYFVIRRYCSNQRRITEVMSSFCLATLIMSAIAIFESMRHWLLYAEVGKYWGGDLMAQYLERGGVIRATATAGHSLALGYLIAIAIGFWLYLRGRVVSKPRDITVTIVFGLGILAAYSRGPWLGALAIYLSYMMLGRRGVSGLIRAGFVMALLAGVILASPLGNRVVQVLPFMGGTVDAFNVDYRHRLMERSLDMVSQNPFFGDQDAYSRLGDLRQGVGVIDFVNVYAEIAVFYGLIGLSLFAGFLLVALIRSYLRSRELRGEDPDSALVGASLSASIIGTMIMLSTSSFIFGYQVMFYVITGLAAGYAGMDKNVPVVPPVSKADGTIS